MNVRWKQSDSFYMENGTRQGSVLSLYLLTVYMRCVTKDVIQTGIGCHIGNNPVCILLYADDSNFGPIMVCSAMFVERVC